MDQCGLLVEVFEAPAYLPDHLLQGAEDPVAEVVLPQVVPEMFHRVEFRAVRRQRDQLHVRRHTESKRPVPTGSIQEHQAVLIREAGCGVGQKERHGFGINPGQD